MKNKFLKPEVEILTFLCEAETYDADSVYANAHLDPGNQNVGQDLPFGGGDLGLSD